MAHFVLFCVGGEEMEKDAEFPHDGFGEMLTLIHVEKSALFCKYYKPGKNATNEFFLRFFAWA